MKLSFFNSEISSIHSAALLLGAAGLLSRLLGVFRDRLLAGHFGAGRELDIYYAAFQIPDFMSAVFLLGAGSAAILPVFQEYLSKNEDDARKLISELMTLFLAASTIFGVAVFLIAPFALRFVVPGFSGAERDMVTALTRIMVLSPILLGLSSILSTVVQSYQRFLAYALAPLLYNFGIILGITVFLPIMGMSGLALGVVLGALFHAGIQYQAVRELGFRPAFLKIQKHLSAGVRSVLRLSFPRVISVSITHITILVLTAIGSTLAAGSIAIFQLAQNLFFVPVGVFGISYAVAIFPRMHRAYLERNTKDFHNELFLGIRTILFWIVPSAVLFIVLRAHIVRVALGAGAFSWEDTRLSAAVLAILALALFAESIVSLLIKGYYSLGNTWKPLFINVFGSLVAIVLGFSLTRLLATKSEFTDLLTGLLRIKDLPHPEVLGLALGFTIGLSLNTLALLFTLKKLARKELGEGEPFPALSLVKIVSAAILGGIAAYGVRASFSETLPLITFVQVLAQGALAGLTGFGVYFGVLFLLKSEEMLSLIAAMKKRLFRLGILPASWNGDSIQHGI